MQLPRGTFREIKKNETVRIILEGLENERFSGVCTLSFPAGDGVLVYRKGKYVLAKVRNLYGDAGIAELRGILDKTGDAALSQLDETQIKLALEFNKQAIVQRSGSVVKEPTTPSPPHNPSHGDTKQPAEKGVQTGTETVIIRPTIPKIRVPPTNNTPHPAPPARVRAPLTQDPQKDEQMRLAAEQLSVSRGYPDARIRMGRSLEDGEFIPQFDVDLGQRVKLNDLRITGLKITNPERIEQRVGRMRGDWYDEALMNRRLREFLATGAFQSARVETTPGRQPDGGRHTALRGNPRPRAGCGHGRWLV